MVQSFRQFLDENREKIDALQFFYSQPYKDRLKFGELKALAAEIEKPPRSWTPDRLWHAYELVEKDKVRGAASERVLTDLVSLVRHALHEDDELVPYAAKVHERFDHWLEQQRQQERVFTPEQMRWLGCILCRK